MKSQIELAKSIVEAAGYTVIKESEESRDTLIKALDDAGIEYTLRGKNNDSIIVSKADLVKASEIRDELGIDMHIASRA